MPLTLLQRLVSPIFEAIARAEERGEITPRYRQALFKSLFYLLMGEPGISKELEEFCHKHRRDKELNQLFQNLGRKIKVPQALYSRIVASMSLRNVQHRWQITKTDVDLIKRILREGQLDPHDEHHLLRRHYEPADLDWLAEAELEHEEVEIILNTQALEDMLLGVFETYKVPKSKKEPFSEVFGLCLGMASNHEIVRRGRGTKTKWFVYVEKAVPQIRAKASQSSVTPSGKSLKALIETSNSLFPQLEIIGDYHSHPYKSYVQLKRYRGWSASQDDALSTAFLYRDLRSRARPRHRMRVSFVIAIAKGRGSALSDKMRSPNIAHFNMAGCHVFITAYRILSNGAMTAHGVWLRRPYRETYLKAG